MMTAQDVVQFYQEMEKSGIDIWLDGGWGVDALLGNQTRSHEDVDIFIQEKHTWKIRQVLILQGYREIKLDIARPYNFVLGDEEGHEIDIHVIVFDGKGSFSYGPVNNGETYPNETLNGSGVVAGTSVKCVSPEWMVRFHNTGYKLRDSDYKDVFALCEKFDIDIPDTYL